MKGIFALRMVAKVCPFSCNSKTWANAPKRCKKRDIMNSVTTKEKTINNGEVETLKIIRGFSPACSRQALKPPKAVVSYASRIMDVI